MPDGGDTADAVRPPEAELRALDELIELGYPRGVMRKLDDIAAAYPGCAGFVAVQRELARGFQFEAMRALLRGGKPPPFADGAER